MDRIRCRSIPHTVPLGQCQGDRVPRPRTRLTDPHAILTTASNRRSIDSAIIAISCSPIRFLRAASLQPDSAPAMRHILLRACSLLRLQSSARASSPSISSGGVSAPMIVVERGPPRVRIRVHVDHRHDQVRGVACTQYRTCWHGGHCIGPRDDRAPGGGAIGLALVAALAAVGDTGASGQLATELDGYHSAMGALAVLTVAAAVVSRVLPQLKLTRNSGVALPSCRYSSQAKPDLPNFVDFGSPSRSCTAARAKAAMPATP